MSRAAAHDNSDAVTLFPFLAVLLCTMGALLVVLVAVARLSREKGLELAAAQQAAAAQPAEQDERRRKLEQANAFIAKLAHDRIQAEGQLREDQQRLGHLEEHIRRLQNRMDTIRLAAAELNGLEEEHYDDREQAERELARMHALVADQQKDIAALRDNVKNKPRSYAILPFKGGNGTRRPPIYIECRGPFEVILQPEGIRLTEADFEGPPEVSSPLAAAIRAAREHAMRNATAAHEEPLEPYPLILVRPRGNAAFASVSKVIEGSGINFGYELVGRDWNLKFPPPDPVLADAEQQAIDLARRRLDVIAAAAPRAFKRASLSNDDESDEFDEFDNDDRYNDYATAGGAADKRAETKYAVESSGSGNVQNRFLKGASSGGIKMHSGGSLPGGLAGSATGGAGNGLGSDQAGSAGRSTPGIGSGLAYSPGGTGAVGTGSGGSRAGDTDNISSGGGGTGDGTGGAGDGSCDGDASSSTGSASTADDMAEFGIGQPGTNSGRSSSGSNFANASTGSAGPAGDSAAGASAGGGSSAIGSNPGRQMASELEEAADNRMVGQQRQQSDPDAEPLEQTFRPRGKDWAIEKRPGSVPIRRTIRVVVRDDRLAILPDSPASAGPTAGGREIRFAGPTAASLEEIVTQLQAYMQDWGMAGNDLHWRPVLEMTVGPDGQRRANDLARLLKNSGLELRTANVADQNQGTEARATR